MRGAQLPPLQERASEKSDAGLQNVPKGSKTVENSESHLVAPQP